VSNEKFDSLITYIERVAVSTALIIGAALIYYYSEKLVLGPWAPRIVAVLLFLLASIMLIFSGSELIDSITAKSKSAFLAGLCGFLLNLAAAYFVIASLFAAIGSLNP
jgi:hypothetical protein